MKPGIVADIHGNEVALRAVLADASGSGIDQWRALGDLVLFGPRPAEVLQILRDLPGFSALSGNTDRYILTGEQPSPYATAASLRVARAVGATETERFRNEHGCTMIRHVLPVR